MKKIKTFLFLFIIICPFFSLQAQTPYYKNSSPTRASGNVSGGAPFGANSTAGARLQAFYNPGVFGAGIPSGGIRMSRLYFFADSTFADTILYGNITITLGELSSAPSLGLSWFTGASKLTTVISGGGMTVYAKDSNWYYIDISTPYIYNPAKYLFVDITVGSQSPFLGIWNTKTGGSGSYLSATNAAAATPNTLSGGSVPAFGFDPFRGLNNAGIERPVISSPCSPFQDVIVKVKNSGTNVINSVTVNWKANGVPQASVLITTPIDTFGSTKSDTTFSLGTLNTSSGPINIQASVSNPNSSSDPDPTNDSVNFMLASAMNGTYTISSTGGDFTSMGSAVQALMTYGVCAPVRLLVDSQTFIEQVLIAGRITGASRVNTVTFEGVDRNKSIISYGPGIVNAKHVIKLQGTAYVNFRNLTISTLSSTYGWGFHLLDTCLAIGIKNCKIDLSAAMASTAANNTAGISISGLPTGLCIPGPCATALTAAARADSLEIDSNLFLYGYEAINITGNATTLLGRQNKIRGNTILFAYQNSINLVSQENVSVSNNTVYPRQTGAANVGIFLSAINSSNAINRSIISSNRIFGYSTAGISLNNSIGSDSINKGLITNNMIGGGEQLPDGNPIYVTGCKNWSISHNSLNRDMPGATLVTAAGIRLLGTTSNISILNNIIAISRTGQGIPIHTLLATNTDSMNNNVLYKSDTITNTQIINIAGVGYPYSTFRGAAGFNGNSLFVKPAFVNDSILFLTSTCGLPNGLYLPSVSTDFNGTSRLNPPKPGAHEMIPPANNMAVLSIKQPLSPVVPGPVALKVLVQNLGSNAVSSFNMAYRYNSGTPVSQLVTPPIALNPCDTMTVTFTSFSVAANDSIIDLLIYSYQPNTLADADRTNDTLRQKLFTPLGGNYNIGGPNASFANFTEAAAALMTGGIKSSVNFIVYPGTYTEQVYIRGPIAGLSSTNRVSFDGIDSSNRILTFQGNGGAPYTFKIENAPYITLRNLNIQNNGLSFGWVVQIMGSSNGCKIKKCALSITGPGTSNTTSNFMGLTVSGASVTTATRVDSLEIDSNTFNYGYQSINIYAATGNIGQFNKIRKNVLLNAQQYSLYLVYQQTPEILNNIIVNRGSNVGVGIYLQNVTTPATGSLFTQIIGNKLSNYATAGIYLNTCANASNALKGRILNNCIGGLEKLPAGNSLYATSSTNWLICNNSINHDYVNTTATTAAAVRLVGSATATQGITLINNIFAVSGIGTGLPLYTQVAGNIDAMDNNLFYRADTTNGFMAYLGTNVGIYALKGFNNFNKNSSIYRPGFTTTTDLIPNPNDSAVWSINGRGTLLSYAPKDLNGVNRPPANWDGVPDIGAYEVTPLSNPPVAIRFPDTSYANGTQTFMFAGDTVARITWGGVVPTNLLVRQYSGALPPNYNPAKNYMYFFTSFTSCPSGFITLYYRDNWMGTHTSETAIRLAQVDTGGSVWTVYTTFSTIDTVRNNFNMPSFSTFSSVTFLTGTNDINTNTPVKLIAFNGKRENFVSGLHWSSASEQNTLQFIVECSMDGHNFETAGKINAAGNSNKMLHYEFKDLLNEFQNAREVIYYRLKMIDKDGSYAYSSTIELRKELTIKKENLAIFPNPFTHTIYIDASETELEAMEVKLFDLEGKLLSSQTIQKTNASGILEFCPDNTLPAGFYLLNINGQMVKLMKQ